MRCSIMTSSKCIRDPFRPSLKQLFKRVLQTSCLRFCKWCVAPYMALPTVSYISPRIEIPAQARSVADAPFLVPSSCQSICQNYSDLLIGGDQVLPLPTNDGELRLCTDTQAVGPFLQSCDVPPAAEDSPPGKTPQGERLHPPRGGSNRWRLGSARDRSVLFQGREGPFSNSLLNHYLEQKLLDLYQQYMMENMAREGAPGADSDPVPMCPLLCSELVLTSLDQITLQLSWEGNLEAGLAKDMVLSCLLRVAGDMQSSEISTPFLQISNDIINGHKGAALSPNLLTQMTLKQTSYSNFFHSSLSTPPPPPPPPPPPNIHPSS
uniref:TLR adaptor interacting with endolysosomal SLC15A4 n=1 Tax=Cyclopterus lumpus TaxID=8103 RepID=A0A8C2ZPM5_CYCLU